jgi:hypothetical protein
VAKYTRESAIRKIISKGGRIEAPSSTPNGTTIGKIDMTNADAGNGTWGAVDYMTQYGGYVITGYPSDNQGKPKRSSHRSRDRSRESMEMIDA